MEIYVLRDTLQTNIGYIELPSVGDDLKGAPAQESRTGTRLVSPALGYEKKKWTPLEQGFRMQN